MNIEAHEQAMDLQHLHHDYEIRHQDTPEDDPREDEFRARWEAFGEVSEP